MVDESLRKEQLRSNVPCGKGDLEYPVSRMCFIKFEFKSGNNKGSNQNTKVDPVFEKLSSPGVGVKVNHLGFLCTVYEKSTEPFHLLINYGLPIMFLNFTLI